MTQVSAIIVAKIKTEKQAVFIENEFGDWRCIVIEDGPPVSPLLGHTYTRESMIARGWLNEEYFKAARLDSNPAEMPKL
jgi:hypothetical protein